MTKIIPISELSKYLASAPEMSEEVNDSVREIIAQVKLKGDEALYEYTKKFDRFIPINLQLDIPEHIDIPGDLWKSLEFAAKRIEAYHQHQMPKDFSYIDDMGVKLGNRWLPIERVGLYVPGGLASYPSSVLMNAIAAKVAGVKDIAMVVPTPDGVINPAILAAAKIADINEIYAIGGAQAIAALAFGTKIIKKVDKIVGPGNAYVAAAKKQLYGIVGIDMIAGPTDILVISDNKNPPEWIAADLLSQAEHGEDSKSMLITNDREYALMVINAVEQQLKIMSRRDIAAKSWKNHGFILIIDDLYNAHEIINQIAPEHLEIAIDNPEILAAKIRNAGAIFLGRFTPEAIGDYVAGPSHVLPTAGSARFSSGLSVYDFLKRISIMECADIKTLENVAIHAENIAITEGLDGHKLSIAIRRETY